MDAIVTAGGIPKPGEPLYEYTQGKPKALLDIAGKPMVQWVLDALCEAQHVERIVLVGLPEDSPISCEKLAGFLPSQGGLLTNLRSGLLKSLEIDPQPRHILTVSSDIPGITAEMVDWLVEKVRETEDEVYYTVVSREVMEARYPTSSRSYTRLKDLELCGGDMNAVHTTTVTAQDSMWEEIIEARKNALKQALMIGIDTLILLLVRALTMEDAVKRVCRRLKIEGRAILSPYAEIAMDVDKPHQLEIMRADLAQSQPQKQGAETI